MRSATFPLFAALGGIAWAGARRQGWAATWLTGAVSAMAAHAVIMLVGYVVAVVITVLFLTSDWQF